MIHKSEQVSPALFVIHGPGALAQTTHVIDQTLVVVTEEIRLAPPAQMRAITSVRKEQALALAVGLVVDAGVVDVCKWHGSLAPSVVRTLIEWHLTAQAALSLSIFWNYWVWKCAHQTLF